MKFVITGLGNWAPAWRFIETATREAEKHDFWGEVFPDQYMWDPRDLGADSFDGIDSTLDSWVLLAHLAARTERIRLGTWVTPIPLRPPAVLAKVVSTLDVISEGRALLGVGAGSTPRLFEAFSQWDTPGVRVDKTREGIELLVRLWKEKEVDYHGKYYQAKGAVLDPKPLQKPYPPLLFGGAGKRMLHLAGRYADICYIPPWNKMSLEESKNIVVGEARRHGREDKVSFAAAYTPLGPGQSYDTERYQQEVEKARQAGFSYFITAWNLDVAPWEMDAVSLPGVTRNYLACMKDFAENVMPSFT